MLNEDSLQYDTQSVYVLLLLTMTCFSIRQQNKTSRAGAVIGTGDVHTAQSTAMIPEATLIDICQKKHLVCQNNAISQREGIWLMKQTNSLQEVPVFSHSFYKNMLALMNEKKAGLQTLFK